MKRPTIVLTVALVALVALAAVPARGEAPPYTREEVYLPSLDGTPLHGFLFRPSGLAPGDRTPVIVQVTPYASTGGFVAGSVSIDPLGDPEPGPGSLPFFERGYSYLVVSLRGYGGSGGCFDLGGPGEQADAQAAVSWARHQPWSTGKVGMLGHSYPGWTQLMAMASSDPDHVPDAVVVGAPPTGYRQLYMNNGVRKSVQGALFPLVYGVSDLAPPSLRSPADQHLNALTGTAGDPTCYATTPAGSYDDRADSPYWEARELPRLIAASPAGRAVPTLWVHGFNDHQVRPSNLLPVWELLTGPRRAFLGPWDHALPRNGTRWNDLTLSWFDEHLKGVRCAGAGPPVNVQSVDGTWRPEAEWPPADSTAHAVPLLPGSYQDLPGNHGEAGYPTLYGAAPVPMPEPLRPNGVGTWTFTPPLPHDLHLAGVTSVALDVRTVAPGANVVAFVYDVEPGGAATLVTRGAYRLPLAPTGETVRFDLYPQDWHVASGHRVGVLLGAADDLWYDPGKTGTPVVVEGGTVHLPLLRHARPSSDGTSFPFRPRHAHPPIELEPQLIETRTTSGGSPPELLPAKPGTGPGVQSTAGCPGPKPPGR